MALKDTYITANGSRGHHKFTLYISEHSTSVANNTSNVGWTLQLTPMQTGWDWSYTNAVSWSVTVAGTTYSGTSSSYDGKSTVNLGSNTLNVAHNADGSKSINFSFSITSLNYSYLPGSASKSGSLTLTPIARKATLSSAPDFTDEQSPTITYSNPAGNAAEKLQACISWTGAADIAYRDISKTGTSYTFNFTDAEKQKLWGAVTSGYTKAVKFYVRTTLGGEYYYSTLDKTLSLVNASPTLAPTVVDEGQVSTSLTGDANNKMIKYYNMMRYNANAAGRKGATIINAGCENGGTNWAGVAGSIGYTGDNVFKFWVEDSRGNKEYKTITKTMVDYINLTVNLKVGKPVLDGEKAKVNVETNGIVWYGNFGASENTYTVQVRYKIEGSEWSQWGNDSVIGYPAENRYTGTKQYTFDYDKSITFQARAYDKVHQLTYGDEIYTKEITVRAKPVFDWGENDFNINVPLMINEVAQETLVDGGTKDGWVYRKYSSGLAECWKRVELATQVNSAWGSMFVGASGTGRIGYPFEFIEKPYEWANVNSGNYAVWLYSLNGGAGNNNQYSSGSYNVCRPTSGGDGTHTFYITIYVRGKWR